MSFFQNSVQQKYINLLDAKIIDAKYAEFKAYFGNPTIQENIRNSKENGRILHNEMRILKSEKMNETFLARRLKILLQVRLPF